jgi:hypothetical protein
MSTNNQTPTDILDIIERKRAALLEERRQKEVAEKRERQEAEDLGRAKYGEYIQAALLQVPEYLRQYVVPGNEEPDFYRIGKSWERPNSWLYFAIPGLAKILFAPNAKESPWKYQTASPYEQRYSYDGDTIHIEPSLSFSDSQYGWTDDLDYALGCAHAELQKYQKYVEEYAAEREEIAREAEQREADSAEKEARNQEAQALRELEQQQEQAEEQALFEAIKSDPIALNMLKAFVLLRDERSHFESRLESADEAIYSVENRWSRRAEELRRQADEADRRAEDDRRRLQDDLDDAEAKLKKAERGR